MGPGNKSKSGDLHGQSPQEGIVEQAVEQLVRRYLAEACRRRSAVLWTPGSNVIDAVREALTEAALGALNLSQAQGLVQRSVDLLFSEATVTEAELLEVLEAFREELDSDSIRLFKRRYQLDLLFLVTSAD
jgi:hypothetical protein